jgi:hypothetical protein
MKTRHLVSDRLAITENRQRDTNGFLISRARIFQPGVVTYLRGEFGLPGDPNEPIRVARLPEDVLHPEAVKSFEGLDVLVGHAMQGRDRKSRARADGNVSGAIDTSDGTMVTDLMIKSEDGEKALSEGVEQISPSFLFLPVKESGEFEGEPYEYKQTEIRGNHIAVVPRGRSGPEVRVFDQHPQTMEDKMDPKEKDGLFAEFFAKLAGFGMSQPAPGPAALPVARDADPVVAALEKLAAAMADNTAKLDAAIKAMPTAPAADKEKPEGGENGEEAASAPAMDEKAVSKAVEERVAALDAFSTAKCQGDPKGMKLEEIKDAVIKQALDEDTSSLSGPARDALFSLACKRVEPKAKPVPAMDAAPGGQAEKKPRLSARDAHIASLNGEPQKKED